MVKANVIIDDKIVAFASGAHVIVSIGAQLDRAVPTFGRDRCDGAKDIHLGFFATEPATHAAHFDGHGMGGNAQDICHHMLGFAGVLS